MKGTARLFTCAVGVLLLAGSLLAQKNPSFLTHRDYVAADIPKVLAADDLNGDGNVDLVVPGGNVNFTNVNVLLANGDGSFQPLTSFDAGGAGPSAAVIADFNGDGKKDVAVTTLAGVSVLLGAGNGTLGTPRMLAAGSSPAALVAGDFNGDHFVDIAVANSGSNDVSIFLGKGDGTFRQPATISLGMGPAGIAMGDFDRDGHMDLVVTLSGISNGSNQGPNPNTVAILLNAGNGTFKPAVFIPVAHGPIGIAVADLNNDNKSDLAVTNSSTNQVSVLLGNGDGTFQNPTTFRVSKGAKSEGFGPSYVAVDDFNADGNRDLAVADPLASMVIVLLGDGTGKFNKAVDLPVGRTSVAVQTGDFNHDGKRDFISSNSDADTVSVVFGNGDGTFVAEHGFSTGERSEQTVVTDFNNDGIPDAATVNAGNDFDGTTVSVLLGMRGARFATQKLATVGTAPLSLAAGDFNNDGRMDLAVANSGKFPDDLGSTSALLGNGDGTFQPAKNLIAGDFPVAVAVGDFNNDGNQDIATAAFHGPISFFLSDGHGNFTKGTDFTQALGNFVPAGMIAADFNRDGNTDIAISTSQSVFLLLGNGNGTFQAARTVSTSFLVFAFTSGDFNQDGILDVAIEEGGVIEMLLGDGQGNFVSAGTFSEGAAATFSVVLTMAVGDFNGDGFLDIAAPNGFADNLVIMLGSGDGTLTPSQLFGVGSAGVSGIAVANFSGTRRLDLVMAGTDTQNLMGKVAILRNNSR